MSELTQQARLALAVKAAVTWEEQQDPDLFHTTLGLIYDSLDVRDPPAHALSTAFAELVRAQRAGADPEKLKAMSQMCTLALLEWVGVDRKTFMRAVAAARTKNRLPSGP